MMQGTRRLFQILIIAIVLTSGQEAKAAEVTEPSPSLEYKVQGDDWLQRGNADLAVDAYQKAIAMDNKIPAVWFNLAVAFYSKRDMTGAIDSLKQLILLDTSDAEAHYNLGCLFLYQADVDAARYHFQKVQQCPCPSRLSELASNALCFVREYETLTASQQGFILAMLANGPAPLE
jgi:Tfp pilus assembly protein PilF